MLEIVEARESGIGVACLAKKYGVGHSTITYHCDRNGVIPPKGIRVGKARVTRGTAFTKEELTKIAELSSQGFKPLAISREIKRPYSSVRYRVVRMALAEEAGLQ